jgi:hypothetical protein
LYKQSNMTLEGLLHAQYECVFYTEDPERRIENANRQIGSPRSSAPIHPTFHPTLESFDSETEALLGRLYGEGHRYLEAYKYATVAEAEALVNLPESAQEPMAKDLPKTALQQRRQVLLGILTDMQNMEAMEAKEVTMLTGEDHENPPSI